MNNFVLMRLNYVTKRAIRPRGNYKGKKVRSPEDQERMMSKDVSGSGAKKWMLQNILPFSLTFQHYPHSQQTTYSVVLWNSEIQPQKKLEIHQNM